GERARILAVLGMIFDDELSHFRPGTRPSTPASQRFSELIRRMPEMELLHHGPEELGKLCGCTGSHFSRLFRRHFGASPRARQTELRLNVASQLLLQSESKIIDVAFESGYRNLSLFNALFKRRYKMTPSEWRRKSLESQKRHSRAAAAAILALTISATLPLRGVEPAAAQPGATPASMSGATNPPAHAEMPVKEATFEV